MSHTYHPYFKILLLVLLCLTVASCHHADSDEVFYGDTIRAKCPTGQTLKYVVINGNTRALQLVGFEDKYNYPAGPLVIPGRFSHNG